MGNQQDKLPPRPQEPTYVPMQGGGLPFYIYQKMKFNDRVADWQNQMLRQRGRESMHMAPQEVDPRMFNMSLEELRGLRNLQNNLQQADLEARSADLRRSIDGSMPNITPPIRWTPGPDLKYLRVNPDAAIFYGK